MRTVASSIHWKIFQRSTGSPVPPLAPEVLSGAAWLWGRYRNTCGGYLEGWKAVNNLV